MDVNRLNRLEETLALDPTNPYARAEQRAVENLCVLANGVKLGDKINHQKTRASAGIYQVVGVRTVFSGATILKIKTFTDSGREIHAALVYQADEMVEVVR